VNQANLESTLLVLPFSHVLLLFTHLDTWLKLNKELLLATRILFFLIKVYQVNKEAGEMAVGSSEGRG
jgi:U3 small nucleolar RNA-associated protein 12